MKADMYKRLFKAIFTEDIISLKKNSINDHTRRTSVRT